MHWRLGESAGDRVYQAIKARVIAYEFPQGERIYLDPLAADLGVSTTPVREAMNRLAAKDLVIKAPRKGFFALTISEENLKGNYELTRLLLTHELQCADACAKRRLARSEAVAALPGKLQRLRGADLHALARYTGELFLAISSISGNARAIHSIENANDHLYYIRTLECQHLSNVVEELVKLCELFLAARCDDLAGAVESYHVKRLRMLSRIVAIVQR